MEVDNNLDFSSHISNVRKKINSQRNVMMRFETLESKAMVSMKYFVSSVHCLCVLRLFRRQ